MLLRQRGQPQRHLGQVDGHRVAVDAVEATLGDEPAGHDNLVIARRHRRRRVVGAPGVEQRVAELAARFDEEGARAHRRVADLQVEDRLWRGRLAAGTAQLGQDRFQRGADDRLGQLARRVMRPRAAAGLTGLQYRRAGRHEVGSGRGVDDRLQGRVQVGDGLGLCHRLAHRLGERPVGPVAQPLGALAPRLAEQRIEVDGGRRALLLLRLDRHRAAGRLLDAEPHHRLVDRADLLHVEGAVGDALAVQHQQLVEGPVDGAVGDQRRLDALVALARRAGPAAFEEREPVGVEEHPEAPRQVQPVSVGAVVEQPEQHQQLRPRPVPLVHRVGMERRVLPQALVEAGQRVVAREGLALRQQVPLFRVEQEDEPQNDREERVVDVVGTIRQRLAQQLAVPRVVGRLHAPQQLVEGVQHLLGQPLAHLVLEAPAVGQQRREPLLAGQGEEPGLAQQQPQGRRDRPARGRRPCRPRAGRPSPSSRPAGPRRGATSGRSTAAPPAPPSAAAAAPSARAPTPPGGPPRPPHGRSHRPARSP